MSYRLNLSKENFKFSVSHFTVFGKDQGERLHGHNYYVSCQVDLKDIDPDLGMSFDFNILKPEIKKICDYLDEYVLIPENSPFLSLEKINGQVRVSFSNKTYEFPESDTRILKTANITAEELARFFWQELNQAFSQPLFKNLAVTIAETRGQSVTYQSDVN